MRNIVSDTVAIIILGLILIASIFFYQYLPPYLSGTERFIFSFIPFIIALLILLIILY